MPFFRRRTRPGKSKDYCICVVKKKAPVKKNICDTSFHFDGCLHHATKKIKWSPG